jgi:cellobiose phosphorylase
MPEDSFYTFLPDRVSFTSKQAARVKTIYAPLCGTAPSSIKSAISPNLSGDIKVDKFHYLTKPASREDLRLPLRDFFVFIKNKGVFSVSQESPLDPICIEIGPLWHKYNRSLKPSGLELSIVNFIPVSGENVELMQVTVKNISRKTVFCTPTFAIALFGRGRDNKHDHEHVTALLNRVQQPPEGVLMQTSMAFNEEGHKESSCVYFVFGQEGQGGRILGSFPTVDSFYGDCGYAQRPQAVFENHKPVKLSQKLCNGKEVVGFSDWRCTSSEPI